MRYCMTLKDGYTTEPATPGTSVLSHRGIDWKVSRVNHRAAYTYKSIRIFWDAEAVAYQVRNHLGQVICQHTSPAVCLEEATVRVLDAMSCQFVPTWEEMEDEIPVDWDEAA